MKTEEIVKLSSKIRNIQEEVVDVIKDINTPQEQKDILKQAVNPLAICAAIVSSCIDYQ